MRYRKRPIEVEAIQWTGENTAEVIDWCGEFEINLAGDHGACLVFVPSAYPEPRLWVAANSSWVTVSPGEWFIRDRLGVYPCNPEVFAATYEPVIEPAER